MERTEYCALIALPVGFEVQFCRLKRPLGLLLVHWHLGTDWRLDRCFAFFLLLNLIERLAPRVHKCCRYKHDEIAFDMLIHIGPEEPADHWQVTKDWSAVFGFLDVLAHQATENDSLAIPNTDTRGDLACAEDWLVNDVIGEKNVGRHGRGQDVGIDRENWAAIVDKAFELDHLGH